MAKEKVIAMDVTLANSSLLVYSLPQIISAASCKHSVNGGKSTLTFSLNFNSELVVDEVDIETMNDDKGYLLIDDTGNVPIKTATNSNTLKFSTDINAAVLNLSFTVGGKIGGTPGTSTMDAVKIGGTAATNLGN